MSRFKKVVIVASGLLINDRPPPAAAFVAGVCEKNNIDYDFFDLNIRIKKTLGDAKWHELYARSSTTDSLEELIIEDTDLDSQVRKLITESAQYILQQTPDLVAITAFSFQQYLWTKLLCKELKQQSTVTIVAGGNGISYTRSNGKSNGYLLCEQKLIDYYVLGEGDIALDGFFKGSFELGLNAAGDKYETWVPQLDNLDQLTLPSYKKIPLDDYIAIREHGPTIVLTGSRGCIKRCTFCNVGAIWKKYKFRSADSIAGEILKHHLEVGANNFIFSDSLINGSLRVFKELVHKLIDLQKQYPSLQSIKYTGQYIIRPQSQNSEEFFRLMKQSGCHALQIGIESGSEAVRLHMDKKFSNADIDYHLSMCSRYGITNSLLMFTGYPTETLEQHQETVQALKDWQKYLINDTISSLVLNSPLIILKDTPLDAMRHELGLELYNNEYGNSLWSSSTNPDLTVEERYRRYIELVRLSIELGYTRPAEDVPNIINQLKSVNRFKGLSTAVLDQIKLPVGNLVIES